LSNFIMFFHPIALKSFLPFATLDRVNRAAGTKMSTPLVQLRSWAPFRLDALGLLTMLGADEMSREIGSLSENTLVSCLPLLGSHIIPSDSFMQALHGYTVYNVSDAIQSTTLSGWFSRWLVAQNPSQNTTIFHWSLRSRHRSQAYRAFAVGLLVNSSIIVLTSLIRDYYGAASAITMIMGILVRAYRVAQNRNAIDQAAADTSTHSNEIVKTFILLADGRAVTLLAPRNVVINCFLSKPKVADPVYSFARVFGWIAFAGFVVTIGQATLVVQTVIVIVTLSATVLTAVGVGTGRAGLGTSLQVARMEHPHRNGRRGEAYAMLHLSKEEEETMVEWALFPQRRNTKWWNQYRKYKRAEDEAITIYGNDSDMEKP
jgi:hypothetical protein